MIALMFINIILHINNRIIDYNDFFSIPISLILYYPVYLVTIPKTLSYHLD